MVCADCFLVVVGISKSLEILIAEGFINKVKLTIGKSYRVFGRKICWKHLYFTCLANFRNWKSLADSGEELNITFEENLFEDLITVA